MTTIVGIDPGEVNTGVVAFTINPALTTDIRHEAFKKIPENEIAEWLTQNTDSNAHVFIEGFRRRAGWSSSSMVAGESRLKQRLPHATIVQNMGVKKVVPNETLRLLGLYTFTTPTHHQDLRAAARIGLFGALQDEALNYILYRLISHTLGDQQ